MSAAKKATAKKATAKKATAKKATAKKATAKKATAKKAPKEASKNAPKKAARAKALTLPAGAKERGAKKPARKVAAKKPARASRTASSAAAERAAEAYTLAALVQRIREPVSEDDVRARVAVPAERLKALGAEVGTERIETDCARSYGVALAFVEQASPEQRQALLGLSRRTIEVAIFAAHKDHTLWQAREQGQRAEADRQRQRGVDAGVLLGRARARREQLFEALLAVAGGDPARVAEVRGDYGMRSTPLLLAESLRRLARRGRSLLGERDAGVRARLADTALAEALLAETEALADEVATVVPAGAAARGRVAVSQDEVDLWDGYSLVLFERIVRIFEAGRALDPTVPRLVPIALRGWWEGYARVSKEPGDPGEPGDRDTPRDDRPGGPSPDAPAPA